MRNWPRIKCIMKCNTAAGFNIIIQCVSTISYFSLILCWTWAVLFWVHREWSVSSELTVSAHVPHVIMKRNCMTCQLSSGWNGSLYSVYIQWVVPCVVFLFAWRKCVRFLVFNHDYARPSRHYTTSHCSMPQSEAYLLFLLRYHHRLNAPHRFVFLDPEKSLCWAVPGTTLISLFSADSKTRNHGLSWQHITIPSDWLKTFFEDVIWPRFLVFA